MFIFSFQSNVLILAFFSVRPASQADHSDVFQESTNLSHSSTNDNTHTIGSRFSASKKFIGEINSDIQVTMY